ncbi:developmental pluripotency-associated protein 4-like [Macrotis lagotis]|uniref:developmental pluripotency-associated protein 4-like n=1 Tax=Macrotis lagotis TaxID=92651 RepID=UPI003D68257C
MKEVTPREVEVASLEVKNSSVEVEEDIPANNTDKTKEVKMVHESSLAMDVQQRENGTVVMAAWAKLLADAQAKMKVAPQLQGFTLAESGNLEEAVVHFPKKTKSDIDSSTSQKSQNDEVPSMPTPLPPLHILSRNILQVWCQRLNISKNGRKHILYKRLLEHVSPSEQDTSSIEEKTQWLKIKTEILSEEDSLDESQTVAKAAYTMTKKKKKRDTTKTALVQTASMASWSRLMATVKSKAVWPMPISSESTRSEQSDLPRWCVVHGEVFPNNVSGSAPLKFHGGQTWVPENDILIPLLLLPTCSFPPPEVEDNWLCPKCVNRNKILVDNIL